MIFKATEKDMDTLAQLAFMMWDSLTPEDLRDIFHAAMMDGKTVFFLLYCENHPSGFAQCSLRYDYVEGTSSSPVGYLEGIFVKEEFRNKGYATSLLKECEKWAAENGCLEFASDCGLENTSSLQFHLKTGFAEVNRIICFTKKL